MLQLLHLVFALVLSSACFGQVTKNPHLILNAQTEGMSDQKRLKELVSIHDGTYQIRISNEDYSAVLTVELFDAILSSRQQNSSIILEVDEFVDIYVPSFSQIENDSFTPIESIVYTTEAPSGSTITE